MGFGCNEITCTLCTCCHRVQIVFKKWFWHKHCRCFNDHSKWVEGAADLLRTLSQSHLLEEVDLAGCFQIPAAAWQQLRGAKWPNMKKACFNSCLAKREMVEGVLVFLTVCTVQICRVCNIYLFWKMCEFRVNVRFLEIVVWVDLGWVSDAMKLPVLCVLVVIGPNCFQEMILTQTLQVLQLSQQGGRGSCRSSRSSQPIASAGRVEFLRLFSDPSSRVAEAAQSDLEKLEESPFQRVPRKKRNGWKVFLCF